MTHAAVRGPSHNRRPAPSDGSRDRRPQAFQCRALPIHEPHGQSAPSPRANCSRHRPEDEKTWLTGKLEHERAALARAGQQRAQTVLQALSDPQVLLCSAAYFFALLASNGLSYWLPTMIKSLSGFSNMAVALLVSMPYSLGVVAKLLAGLVLGSHRRATLAHGGPLALGSLGLGAGALAQGQLALALLMAVPN